jgi:hypothetical protein
LADGATEQAPGSAVGSLARAGTSSSPSCRRCRAPQVPSTGPRFGGPAGGRWSGVSVRCLPCRGRPVRVLGRVHASGVRCPGDRPVSAHVMSTIRCPLSGVDVRCPGVGVRAFRVRVRGVWTGDFVERVGAAGSRTARRGRVWPSRRVPERLDHRPEPGWLLLRTVWCRSGCVAQAGGGDHAPWSPWKVQGRVAWSLRAFLAGLRLTLAAVARPQHAVSAARSTLATL